MKKVRITKKQYKKSAFNYSENALNTKKSACNTKIILCLLIALLLINLVTALGIRPAKTTLNSEEIKVYKSTIWVVNNDHQNLRITISPGGEFGQYIKLSTPELFFREDIDALPVEFEITLPQDIPPGGTSAHLIIEEKPTPSENKNEDNDNSNIGAKISLKHKITIQNGYPEKYIEPKLNFHESGDNIRLVSEVENKGKKDITQLKTKFYINNILQNKQEKIEAIETESTTLKTKENKLLEATIPKSQFTSGEFEVNAITTYDDLQIEMTKKLIVGKPEIDITYFDKYFKANEINKYSLDLLNKWNTEIENVFVDIIVKKQNEQIDQFRTKTIDIDAHTTEQINDYLDAKNKNPGTYTFDMIVNFWNSYKMETKTFHSELLSPEQEQKTETSLPRQNALTGNAIENDKENKNSTTENDKPLANKLMGILLTLSFIILTIGVYLIYKARTPPQEKSEQQEF